MQANLRKQRQILAAHQLFLIRQNDEIVMERGNRNPSRAVTIGFLGTILVMLQCHNPRSNRKEKSAMETYPSR